MQLAAILSFAASLTPPYFFSELSYKRHDFRNEMCFFIFSTTLSETILILRRIYARYNHNSANVFMKNTRDSSQILMKLEFSRQIFEIYPRIIFNEGRPVGSDLFHANGQTHMTKLIVLFRNFANAPEMQ